MSTTLPDAQVWRDGKRYAWLLGLIVPMLPLAGWGLVELTGLGLFWWFGMIFLFILLPLVDTVIGEDSSNPPESVLRHLEDDRYYRWCTYLFLPIQFGSLVWASWMWAHGDLGVVDKVGLAMTMGVVAGVAINTAHELGHKTEKHERWFAKIALAQSAYGHFYVEHNKGHHVRVATPEDPASSRLGETFWRFLPRTVVGSLRSAWGIEKRRLERAGHRTWTWRNDNLNAWAMTVVLFGALVAIFGLEILPYLAIQAVVGFTLLEVVNYLEHYGLMRELTGQTSDGRNQYVRVDPRHSWNSNRIGSNVLLYHLQRHSDHHARASRRFQALRHFDESPQLPSGYATMIAIAVIPPVWRRVMDHRVDEHYQGDLSKANVLPGKKILVGAK